ncbi:hypothetical protein [Mycolicibacterium arenosum]|uniref:Uncharacterized protein n=1 Tax=Mycolicibacterium arenosum TaxID=2952157 RepID=A0ABT1MCG3_9MYCO|nr:hypothetical protein [Mycolicibacterium sp. CAU 1645]MCP9275472.1 hypothetical protein [Mycolicibacterium sp. CAU 1645]
MYVTAERLAIADRAVVETFKQTSIAWQAFPNWNTGDPGQSRVRSDVLDTPSFLPLHLEEVQFQASLAQLGAPTPDSLLAEVMARATKLAAQVDARAFTSIIAAAAAAAAAAGNADTEVVLSTPPDIMDALIDARASVEDAGYRAPSCLITNTAGIKALNRLDDGRPAYDAIVKAANINSVHRTSLLPGKSPNPLMLLIGRRNRMAHGAAAEASPGEEPVDLAVSVVPSLEILGEAGSDVGGIELGLRIRFATRVTDPEGVVRLTGSA